jgi:muconolactone delta-isomerase
LDFVAHDVVNVGDRKWRREAKEQGKFWKIIRNIDHYAQFSLFVLTLQMLKC